MRNERCCFAILLVLLLPPAASAQATDSIVRAINRPTRPLPAEAASADSNRFSFIVYGDTRGRRDGTDVQYEHSLIVDDMLRTVNRLRNTAFPVRFVLQTGDAVVNGRDPRQWNNSFVGLINRLTTDAGLPYYLAPGNHDVTASGDLLSPQRQQGLQNYLRAMQSLIPPDGAVRRLDGYPTYAFGYGNTFVLVSIRTLQKIRRSCVGHSPSSRGSIAADTNTSSLSFIIPCSLPVRTVARSLNGLRPLCVTTGCRTSAASA